MTPTPTPTVYRSRSRTVRQRAVIGFGVLVLVLVGFLIGRLNSGHSSSAAAPRASVPGSPVRSAAPVTPSAAPPSSAPASAPAGTDAYGQIQAENAVAQQGTGVQDTDDGGPGGKFVGWVDNGDWLRFDNIDFGPAAPKQVLARVASDVQNESSTMQIRLDGPQTPPIGSLPIFNTGGWDHWSTQATDVTAVTGVHTVYVTFASGSGDDFLNLNWLQFTH